MIQLEQALVLLAENRVDFVIVGGVAATVHGSSYATYDLDVCYSRVPESLERLARALEPYHPKLRGAPEGLPFVWGSRTLANGLHPTLTTDLGDLDLLGDIVGVGGYEKVRAAAVAVEMFGYTFHVLGLDGLIDSKRASGRPKDSPVLTELEALREALGDDSTARE
jgi:hypothetical protein